MRFCPTCRTQLWAVGDALAGYFQCACGWVSENWPRERATGKPLVFRGRRNMTLYFAGVS